jgi:hypothetical protein
MCVSSSSSSSSSSCSITCIKAENDNDWMNNKFAQAVMMAEQQQQQHQHLQQNSFTMPSYDCDRTLFSQHDNNCLQHHVYQDRPTYHHNEVPTSSIGYIDNRVSANVSFSLSLTPSLSHILNMQIHFILWTDCSFWRVDVCRSDNHAKTANSLFERNTWTSTQQWDKAYCGAEHLCTGTLPTLKKIE